MKKRLALLAVTMLASVAIGTPRWGEDLDTNIVDNGDGTFSVKKSWLLAAELRMTADPLYDEVKETIRTLSNDEVEQIVPGRLENPSNVLRVERLLTPEMWDYLTPVKNDLYTYTGFLRAVGKFPAFCGDYTDGRDSDEIARKLLATCLAHFSQETGAGDDYMAKTEGIPRWRQSLHYVREMGYEAGYNEGKNGYNAECSVDAWQQEKWPCGTSAGGEYLQYYGRGAKQLSYNFNYGSFSEAMYDGDATALLDNPDLVADTWLNLASAIFFFVYPQPPKPSMLHVMDGTWQPNAIDSGQGMKLGFGATINVINGGVECGHGETKQAANRVKYYKELAPYMGVAIGEDEELGCADQGNFVVGGAGALLIQWVDDTDYDGSRPNGNFGCKLVGYQTMHSALVDNDYIGCVERFYGEKMVIVDDIGEVSIVEGETVSSEGVASGIYFNQNPVELSSGEISIIVVPEEPATVQIAIFDVLGNLIDIQESTSHITESTEFKWDLTNRNGSTVGSGSYLAYATLTYDNGNKRRFKSTIGVQQ